MSSAEIFIQYAKGKGADHLMFLGCGVGVCFGRGMLGFFFGQILFSLTKKHMLFHLTTGSVLVTK